MNVVMIKAGKTKVKEVTNGRRRLTTWIIILMFCLCLFSSDAMAQYSVYNKGDSDVYGYSSAGDLLMYGALFDSVVADANFNSAYGLFSIGGSITIDGTYVNDGYIGGITGTYDAFGLFSPNGSINTDRLDGTINTFAGTNWAVGLFGDTITTGAIDGTITSTAGNNWAVGLYGIDTINTGYIDGTIVARASNSEAYGLLSGGLASIHTGSINGTISAKATYGSNAFAICSDSNIIIDGDIGTDANIVAIAETEYAYGMYSGGSGDANSIHITGNINGKITADVNSGSKAYAMYSDSNIVIDGDIGSTALIRATATGGVETAYGMYSDDSITIGDVNGTISAEMIDGSGAYAIYAANDITIGNIGSDANIWAAAEDGEAYGLKSGGGGSLSIHISDIDGRITADVNDGDGAYAIYSDSNIVIDGDIGSTALISATATGGGEFSAYGMYSGDSITIGDVNGTISAEMTEGSGAYAIYAANDITIGNIGSDANIWAAAEDGDAYGLKSGGDRTIHITGNIDGKITADVNDGSGAYAMYSDSNIVIDGDIGSTALIRATATGGMILTSAYGLYSDDSITIGDVNGTISAEMTDGFDAYAIYAANDITIGDIGSDANIWAAANDGDAYGLYSGLGKKSIHTDNIDGRISADVNDGYNAYAMYSSTDIVIDGDIGSNAEISATAEYGDAYGLYTGGGVESIHITGDVNGLISADVNDGYNAYAMYSSTDIVIDGDIGVDANIVAVAGTYNAFGLYSDSGSIYTGAIDGNITATTGTGYAYGLGAWNGSIETGNIGGTIDANAGEDWAGGLYSYYDLTTGDIDGTITVTGGTHDAYGLYSYAGDITTGDVNGVITATAGDSHTAGLYSALGSIDVNDIDGVITAEAINGSYAYGLYSGAGDSIYIDNITGTITADANGSHAYAIRSYGDIVIDGNITSNAEISATTSGSYAYGLFSEWGDVNTVDINGTIDANAGGNRARGLFGWESVTTGDITGAITAIAGGDEAAGLFSGDYLITGDITGTIDANAAGYYARGLFAGGSLTTGDITGAITATAGSYYAAGLYSPTGSVNTDDIDGTISATAEYSDAYGLYSGGGFSIHTGDVNGTIIADVNNGYNAYGMFSYSYIETGNIGSGAMISATAGTDNAFGLYSYYGYINTGDISGMISATTGTYWTAGLYSNSNSITTGAINGTISATAEYGYAYGLYSGGVESIHITGDVNGLISADVNNGSDAYGMYSYGDIIIDGNITSNAEISATTSGSYAYGLFSEWGDVNTVDINGTIDANAGGNKARGLFGWESVTTGNITGAITAIAGGDEAAGLFSGDYLITGDITGTIDANAAGYYARGLFAGGSLTTGDITGAITATAGSYYAAGLYSPTGSVTTGNIDGGIISATAEYGYAYGLYSGGGLSIHTGDVNGVIIADVNNGSDAYGMYSNSSITTGDFGVDAAVTVTAGGDNACGLAAPDIEIGALNGTIIVTADANSAVGLSAMGLETGPIDGTITVVAGVNNAYGLTAYDMETGPIGGTVSATAGNNYAVGLYASGSDSLTTGLISGTIDANAMGDFAYGILSYGPMDVNVAGGTVRAVANDGNNVAAVQSGQISGDPQDANDTVGIAAGSTIVGDIDLAMNGTDNDVLTLWGADSNSTIFADDINNVETININGGHWYVNGSVLNNLNGITMNGGILSGTGTLETLYVGDGIFSPGGSIGTITVDNLVFSSGSIFVVDVNNAEDADKVIVNDTASLDGTISGNVYGSERIDHSFTTPEPVIDANVLSGEFADVNGTTLFPIFSVIYDTDNNDVYLNVLFDYAYYARTGNQHAVGQAFNHIVSNDLDTGDMNDVLSAIEHLPDGDAANEAYNQLMPQDMLGLPDVTRRIMNQHNDGIMERMDHLRRARQYSMLENNRYLLADAGNSFALPSDIGEWMPFVKGIGVWADRDSERDIAGYKYSVYGVVAGMDKQVSDNSLLGFGIGGTKASVDYSRAGTEADIDSLLLSLHGSYFGDGWFFDYTAGYGHSWYDQQRSIGFLNRTAKSDHKSDAFSVAIEYGMSLGGSMAILEPVAGMGYTLVREGGYTESDAGAANLKVDSETSDGFYSKLGLQATTEMQFENNPNMVMVPKLSAFWIHDFADRVELSSSFVGGGSFTTDGLDPVRDMFNIGAGLNAYFNSNTRIFVDYVWQFSSDFESNMLQAGIQWPF